MKIGVAVSVEKRLRALRTGNPHEIDLLAELRYRSRREAYGAERTFHRWLAPARTQGEWFRKGAVVRWLRKHKPHIGV